MMYKRIFFIILVSLSFVVAKSIAPYLRFEINDPKKMEDVIKKTLLQLNDVVEHKDSIGYSSQLGDIIINQDSLPSIAVHPRELSSFIKFMGQIAGINNICYNISSVQTTEDLKQLYEIIKSSKLNYDLILDYYVIYNLYWDVFFSVLNQEMYDSEMQSIINKDEHIKHKYLGDNDTKEYITIRYLDTPHGRLLRIEKKLYDIYQLTFGILRCKYDE